MIQPTEGASGQPHHRSDGKVNFAIDNDEGHDQRDDDFFDR